MNVVGFARIPVVQELWRVPIPTEGILANPTTDYRNSGESHYEVTISFTTRAGRLAVTICF